MTCARTAEGRDARPVLKSRDKTALRGDVVVENKIYIRPDEVSLISLVI